MVVRCAKDSLNIHTQTEVSAQIAARFNCSPFQASLLEMRGLTADVMPKEVENWLSPYLPRLLEKLDLGADNANAAALVRGLGPSSDVVVYGDYDVDGISATAIAMELALSKATSSRTASIRATGCIRTSRRLLRSANATSSSSSTAARRTSNPSRFSKRTASPS